MKRALYLAVNKDTDELHSERVKYDKLFCEALMSKAEGIITSNEPPARAFPRRDYYECGWCDAQAICWGPIASEPALPVKSLSCRQCCHATPVMSGNASWSCKKHSFMVGKTCEDHLCLPGLFTFATPEGYGEDEKGRESIVFKNEDRDGTVWRHGSGENCFSSTELLKLSPVSLTNGMVTEAKELFGAEVTSQDSSLLDRYPKEECEIIWSGHEKSLVKAWKAAFNEDLFDLEMIDSSSFPDYRIAEFSGGRVAIVWCDGKAEIRKGKE